MPKKKRVKLKINFIIKFKQLLSKEDGFSIKKQLLTYRLHLIESYNTENERKIYGIVRYNSMVFG